MQKPIEFHAPENIGTQPLELQELYHQFYNEYMEELHTYNEFSYDSYDTPEFEEAQPVVETIEPQQVQSNESNAIAAQKAEVMTLIDRAEKLLNSIVEEGKRLKRVPSKYYGKNKSTKEIVLEPKPVSSRTKALAREIQNGITNAYGILTAEQWQAKNFLHARGF